MAAGGMIPAVDLSGHPVRQASKDLRIVFAVSHWDGRSWLMARSERRRLMDSPFPGARKRYEWVFDRAAPLAELSPAAYPFHERRDGSDCVECSTRFEAAEDLADLEFVDCPFGGNGVQCPDVEGLCHCARERQERAPA
jgi:hypothetical protein